MSYFSSIFKGNADETEQQQQPQEEQRPLTRAQARAQATALELPSSSVGISSFNGIARGRRTPSPRPPGHNANTAVTFSYDSTNISQQTRHHQEDFHNTDEFDNASSSAFLSSPTAKMNTPASIEELRAAAAAAVEAANAATSALAAAAGLITQQSAQQQTQQRVRKPDLPEFDPKNIEIWIKRMQAAYDRAGIVLPKDKFAFLESKFAVGSNPSIDAFLYGPADEANWTAFITYLRNEYGRTIRQEAQFIRSQHSRDGRRPSQMLAHLKEKVKRVSVDDILKEIVISSLPTDVQQMIVERVKDATAEQAAEMADKYFDQEGKPLHSRPSPIQHIDATNMETIGEDDADINAVNGRRANFRPRGGASGNRFTKPFSSYNSNNNNNNGSGPPNHMGVKNQSGSFGASSNAASNASSTPSAAASSSKTNVLCYNHQRYGDETRVCQKGCSKWTGNGSAGSRK